MRTKKRILKKNEVVKLLGKKLSIDEDVLQVIIDEYWKFVMNSFHDYDSVQTPIGRIDATCTKQAKLYIQLKVNRELKKKLRKELGLETPERMFKTL